MPIVGETLISAELAVHFLCTSTKWLLSRGFHSIAFSLLSLPQAAVGKELSRYSVVKFFEGRGPNIKKSKEVCYVSTMCWLICSVIRK